MQVPEGVIQFVKNESDNKLRGKMVAKLIENPQATIDDLKKFYVVEKESWDIALKNLLEQYQLNGNLENYKLNNDLITSTVEEAKELNKNLGGQIKFESSFPTITLTVNDKVYIYDDTSIEKSIASFLKKLHSLTGNYKFITKYDSKTNTGDADIKTGIIQVVKCESRQDLITHGAGENWCVCDPSNASHYISDKVNKNATFYIVFDGLKNKNDPAKKVLISIGENDEPIEYADIRNGGEIKGYNNSDKYYEYLEGNGINTKQFVNDPMSDEEREIIEKVQDKNENTEWFKNLSYEEQTYYISMGYDLTNAQFDIVMEIDMPKAQQIVLDAYVNTGKSLPSYQLNQFSEGKFLDYKKSYNVSRKTYLSRIKEKFENKPKELIEFAFETTDRELLLELYEENKFNDDQISEIFTILFAEDEQFYVRLGLEPSKVASKIDWEKVVEQKLLNNTYDENFEKRYKSRISSVLPRLSWGYLFHKKDYEGTIDVKFLKLVQKYDYLRDSLNIVFEKWVQNNKNCDELLEAFPEHAKGLIDNLFRNNFNSYLWSENFLKNYGKYLEKYDNWYPWIYVGEFKFTIEDLIVKAGEFKHAPNFTKALKQYLQNFPKQNSTQN